MASSVDAKLLKLTKFPAEFSQKVDMQKVNVEVMKKWIAGKISDILGNEDDVVIELCFNLLEGSRNPDIKVLQIQLTGFLDKDTAKFCKELWLLCLSAQSNPQGVPKELLEAKKLELIQEKVGSMLRKLPKRHNAAKSKNDSEIATSITSGNERGANEGAAAGAEATEEGIVISIGVRHEIQGLHLPDAEAHHLAFVVFRPNVRLIRTFRLVEVVAGQMTGDAGRLPTRCLDLRLHLVEDTKTTILRDHAVVILQADLEVLRAGAIAEIEIRELGDVVIIEQDPTHPQIPLAHVPPDEVEKDAPHPCYLVAPHQLQEADILAEDGIRHLHRALIQQAGTEDLRAEQKIHLPMTDRFPTLTATELREKLLREKVKALRNPSSTQKKPDADEG
ncbi:MAG: hypothetical protein ASARMPRED_001000 [Alectoria sarmentosa]|nr:MAG: hypothetical protein ASARMPRED_001000 [Alectoria sarmentosa]